MNRFANPVPVSGPPAQPPPKGAVGNTGVVYGIQSRVEWRPGEVDPRGICDSVKAQSLWRFSAFGRVTISINYGTLATRKIEALRTPLVITLPGQFTATATPIDARGAVCDVTLTPATASNRSIARRFVSTFSPAELENERAPAEQYPIDPIQLDNDAAYFLPLTASRLTVSGVSLSVAPLQTVPLVAGSILNNGSGFQEFEA